ncbi:MAG: hypothetical protein ACYTAN_09715 [Planctomycetota bacterium]|jgi:hypothetical protein
MSDEKNIGEEMLSANGLPPFGLAENDRLQLRKLLARDRKRVRRTKIAAVIAWAMLPVIIIAMRLAVSRQTGPLEPGTTGRSVTAVSLVPLVLLVALTLTIGLIVRSCLLRNRERQVERIEIQARLAGMEKALRQLAEKD